MFGLGFDCWICGLEFWVQGLRVVGFWVWGAGRLGVQGLGLRVSGLG